MATAGSVLLADDEDTFRLATAEMLRCRGCRCDTAADAGEAIEMLGASRYDALVADIRMPGNTELELVREVRRHPDPMPVILVTAYPSLQTAVRSIQLPVTAYLTKPIDPEALWTELKQAIRGGRMKRTAGSLTRRLQDSAQDLAEIEQALSGDGKFVTAGRAEMTLAATAQTLLGCQADLRSLSKGLRGQDESVGVELCNAVPCQRRAVLEEAVKDAILVIEGTRKTFKSRELAELRSRLQEVLQG